MIGRKAMPIVSKLYVPPVLNAMTSGINLTLFDIKVSSDVHHDPPFLVVEYANSEVTMSLSTLPEDLLVEIMLLGDSLQDLRNTALSTRAASLAFVRRQSLLLRTVLRNELARLQKEAVSFSALQHAKTIISRLRNDTNAERTIASRNGIPLLEAVKPYVDNGRFGSIYMAWTLKLCSFYAHAGSDVDNKRLTLLERAYNGILVTCTPVFDPDSGPHSGINAGPMATSHRVSRAARAVTIDLARVYSSQGQLLRCLELEKNVCRRLSIKSPECHEWGCRVIKTLRRLERRSESQQFASNLYDICRTNGLRESALTWARCLVSEHSLAGDTTEALLQQRVLLSHLQRGSAEYIAWGRQLVVMQKRAGLFREAVATKQEVWQSMDVRSTCYYGWARELADDYRRTNRFQEAVSVMQTMHEQSQARFTREHKSRAASFHAYNSATALASELQSCGRKHEANDIRAKFCSQHILNYQLV
nr:hypothetical protein CFP56_68680 [Quercus suber]